MLADLVTWLTCCVQGCPMAGRQAQACVGGKLSSEPLRRGFYSFAMSWFAARFQAMEC